MSPSDDSLPALAHPRIVIVGAGAAGLATAIFTRRLNPRSNVTLVDGARRPGAKILVSGGSRCNVTNIRVSELDFCGGSRNAIRQVLRHLTVPQTINWFASLGVALHEEENGKLFPDSNRARDVLDALLTEAEKAGVSRLDACRVTSIQPTDDGFVIEGGGRRLAADAVVLATGGQSIPKSGSDGFGFELARHLGHAIVPPVPALVPLLLDPTHAFAHASVAGVSHECEITVWIDGRAATRVRGSLLWTHFGISGPAALDVSRHWTRAIAEHSNVTLTLNFCAARSFEVIDEDLRARLEAQPLAELQTVLSTLLPSAVAAALIVACKETGDRRAHCVTREVRRRLTHALTAWHLPVVGTRGYNYAEVTAGGVPLAQVNPLTMESRVCRNLFFVGEILDVDGRLGGFNFQWAWSSARTAAQALSARSMNAVCTSADQRPASHESRSITQT